jgi:hypothetical protein
MSKKILVAVIGACGLVIAAILPPLLATAKLAPTGAAPNPPADVRAQPDPFPIGPYPRPAEGLNGRITVPAEASVVETRFAAEGELVGQHRRVWLVERVGQLHWPKEPELRPDSAGKWFGEVNEGGTPPGGAFDLVLMDVSNEAASRFQQWLTRGHRTGDYPGLRRDQLGNDARVLDVKKYRLQ